MDTTTIPSVVPTGKPSLTSIARHWPLWAASILLVAIVLGIFWADEPRHRRRVLFRSPIHLTEGATVSGMFTPEHDGPFLVGISFPLDRPLEDLGAMVGGSWISGAPATAGFAISYTIRNGPRFPIRGLSGDGLTSAYGGERPSVRIAWINEGLAAPSTIDVRVDRAVPGLAELDASITVEATGDWVYYAWVDVELRGLVVILGALLSMTAIIICVVVRRRRRRGAPPEGGRRSALP